MTTLPNMPLVLPSLGGSSGSWDDLTEAIHRVIDDHRHEGVGSGGRKIRTAGLDINADLTMAGFGLTNIDRLAFAAITALTTGARVLFVSSADNELYWRTQSGAHVKITSGASLNVAAFIGGIGGDYTAVAAALNYDNSNLRYTLRQGGGTTWARMASGEVRIYETSSTDTVYVGMAAPAALAASYTVTMPLALPASTAIMQVGTAGVASFSNAITVTTATLSQQVLLTGAITPTTLNGTHQDYNPTGLSTANTIRLSSTAATDALGGIAGGADGRILVLTNVGSPDVILNHEDAGSTAANRFALPNGGAVTLRDNGGATLRYDGTSARWRLIGLAA